MGLQLKNKFESPSAKQRNSNLELFRIITMLLIVAHHYVVNSGMIAVDGPILSNPLSWRSIFLLLFSAWGKTGINCFVLITGYFMCKSQITAKKFAKLLFEIMLYKIVFYIIFLCSGYQSFSVKSLLKALLPFSSVAQNFSGCFLLFFLFIPFLNILIKNLTEKQHILLLLLEMFIYVFFGTVKFMSVGMNYVSWFVVLYFIASYIRLYPKRIFENTKFWGIATLISVAVAGMSVIGCAWVNTFMKSISPYFFVTDSNTFLAVTTGLSAFMFFKNIKIKNSRFINTVAASTFGVLLIHSNSGVMRQWLWKDTLNVVGQYNSQWLVLHAIISVIGIYIVCTLIDYLRIRFVEKPFFMLWDKKYEKILSVYKKAELSICKTLKIEEE